MPSHTSPSPRSPAMKVQPCDWSWQMSHGQEWPVSLLQPNVHESGNDPPLSLPPASAREDGCTFQMLQLEESRASVRRGPCTVMWQKKSPPIQNGRGVWGRNNHQDESLRRGGFVTPAEFSLHQRTESTLTAPSLEKTHAQNTKRPLRAQ